MSIEPPRDVCEALLRELERAVDLSNARPVPASQIHMTLQFIGETDARELVRVRESVERSASGLERFDLEALCLIQLPERGRPRLVAAETDAPATLLEIKRRLAQRLARSPRKDGADRFTPHLTLCRYGRVGPVARLGRDGAALSGVPGWGVDRLRLMSSVLRPEGAEHRVEAEFGLE